MYKYTIKKSLKYTLTKKVGLAGWVQHSNYLHKLTMELADGDYRLASAIRYKLPYYILYNPTLLLRVPFYGYILPVNLFDVDEV